MSLVSVSQAPHKGCKGLAGVAHHLGEHAASKVAASAIACVRPLKSLLLLALLLTALYTPL